MAVRTRNRFNRSPPVEPRLLYETTSVSPLQNEGVIESNPQGLHDPSNDQSSRIRGILRSTRYGPDPSRSTPKPGIPIPDTGSGRTDADSFTTAARSRAQSRSRSTPYPFLRFRIQDDHLLQGPRPEPRCGGEKHRLRLRRAQQIRILSRD